MGGWLGELTAADLVGVVGSVMICAAYWAVSGGRVDPQGLAYHAVNGLGAALLLFSLWFRPNPGAILIEAVWLAIAAHGAWRAVRR